MIIKCYSTVVKSETLHNLFVYGRLKRGEKHHEFLTNTNNGSAKYFQDGETVSKYPLIIFTNLNIPCLIRTAGVGYNVEGEIYKIDDLMLKNLDTFEAHPNFYFRYPELIKGTQVVKNETDVLFRCWTYFFNLRNSETFDSELLKSYSSKKLNISNTTD